MAKGVEVRLYDASGTAQANLTGLQCAWFDEAEPKDFSAPRGVTPTGAHDAYQLGSRVRHNDLDWESIVSNNVWEPGIYGWMQI